MFDGQARRSLLIIFRQPGANIIETVDRIRALLPQLEAEIPADIDIDGGHGPDARPFAPRSHDVQIHAADFDRPGDPGRVSVSCATSRATFIPSVAVPVSLIGTFGVMYLCGYSLDNLSLMALTIATGFVVDDAIVVIENISRHLEKRACRRCRRRCWGPKEIGFTVLSISVSLVAVFIPILLMSGIVGRLFREFAVTLSVAIGVSMVVSLTTTPMMCATLLKTQGRGAARPAVSAPARRVFDWILGCLRADAALGAAASVHDDAGHAGDDRLHGLSVRRSFPRDSSRSRTPAA